MTGLWFQHPQALWDGFSGHTIHITLLCDPQTAVLHKACPEIQNFIQIDMFKIEEKDIMAQNMKAASTEKTTTKRPQQANDTIQTSTQSNSQPCNNQLSYTAQCIGYKKPLYHCKHLRI